MKTVNISSKREQHLYKWINKILPNGDLSKGEKNNLIYHLIGTDRSFGVFFPEFFIDEEFVSSNEEASLLFKIFQASRAYLIAHDALEDEDRSNKIRAVLKDSAPIFRKECLMALEKYLGESNKAEKIISFRDGIVKKVYSSNFSKRAPSAEFACERVAYWYMFFDALEEKGKVIKNKKHLFDLSLFLLQTADDFSDIYEDCQKEKNCNLLGWNQGQNIILSKEILEKYALLSIWYSAKQIISEFSNQEPMEIWAEEILSLIITPEENQMTEYCNFYFKKEWPHSYIPPHLNLNLEKYSLPKIELNTMNGVKLSAESINSFASNRALSKITKMWDIDFNY